MRTQSKIIFLISLLFLAAEGVYAQWSVTMKDGTEDASQWEISPSSADEGTTVIATYSGQKHVKSVTYSKVMRVPLVVAPTAKELTYSGSAQSLINEGSTSGGTMQYKLGDGSWSTAVPTATNAGTYTVWYRVQGTEAYEDVAEASIQVVVEKALAAAKTAKSAWAIGDVICGNSSAYTVDANHKLSPSLTPTAIVAYKGSATGDAAYTNGLAIALTDANGGTVCNWKTTMGTNDNDQRSTAIATQLGYKESGRIISVKSNRNQYTTWPAFYYADYARYNKFYPSSVTSSWFVASVYQWNLIVKGLTGSTSDLTTTANSAMAYTKVNAKIVAAGGTGLADAPYWTSSEYNSNRAWCYRATGMAGFNDKTGSLRVRPIVAF